MPLRSGARVLEIGGAPGAAAREVAARIADGHILVIDRSEKGVEQIRKHAASEIAAGTLSVRCVAIEEFSAEPDDEPFDLIFANRVGALDGRHPDLEAKALRNIRSVLRPGGRFYLDGCDVTHRLGSGLVE